MTENTESTTTATKSPTHIAYHVRNRDGQKGIFTRVGAAWPHKDGKGFDLRLNAFPVDGQLCIRVATEKKDQ